MERKSTMTRYSKRLSTLVQVRKEVRFKATFVGDGTTGKTSILIVYSKGIFPEEYLPTVFENYAVELIVENYKVVLSIWDTAGQEAFDRLRPLSYPDTTAVVICFAVDLPNSLANVLEKWYPEIHHFLPGVPIILVGCKIDLRTDSSNSKIISYQEGKSCAETFGAFSYIETSAKLNLNVQELFHTIAKASLSTLRRSSKKDQLCCTL